MFTPKTVLIKDFYKTFIFKGKSEIFKYFFYMVPPSSNASEFSYTSNFSSDDVASEPRTFVKFDGAFHNCAKFSLTWQIYIITAAASIWIIYSQLSINEERYGAVSLRNFVFVSY